MDISKLKPDYFLAYLFLTLSLVIPGAGYIYMADPNLFATLESFRLVLLSIFYSLPMVLMALLFSIYTLVIKSSVVEYQWVIANTGIISLLYYFSLTSSYLRSDVVRDPIDYLYTIYLGSLIFHIVFTIGFLIWGKWFKK